MGYDDHAEELEKGRTAGEVGWHVSRYNLMAEVPDSKYVAIANLFKGNCAEYSPIEMYLLSVIEELDEHHPIIERFARRGVIANFDERAALDTMGRAACAMTHGIGLTICPTMGCNFDCPYCFEDHFAGRMSAEVQDDVVALAERMLDASGAKNISVSWFGGEPLLAPDIIESLSVRLMELAEKRGGEYSAGIVTNGYLLTQEIVDMLVRCKVDNAQVTIDGMGATHDATRRLANGGPKALAEESGNDLMYYPAPVTGSDTADERGEQVDLLCGSDSSEVGIKQEAKRFRTGRGNYCGAHTIWGVGIDERGNLQKCWEAVDKPALSYGTAHDWDPKDPLVTASNPDNLTMYLNTACPVPDDECQECVWLPMCVGGCPHKRLFSGRQCIGFKDNPEAYVLALHARIGEEKEEKSAPDSV